MMQQGELAGARARISTSRSSSIRSSRATRRSRSRSSRRRARDDDGRRRGRGGRADGEPGGSGAPPARSGGRCCTSADLGAGARAAPDRARRRAEERRHPRGPRRRRVRREGNIAGGDPLLRPGRGARADVPAAPRRAGSSPRCGGRKLAEADELARRPATTNLKDPFLPGGAGLLPVHEGEPGRSAAAPAAARRGERRSPAAYAEGRPASSRRTRTRRCGSTRSAATAPAAWAATGSARSAPASTSRCRTRRLTFDGAQKGTSDAPTMIWQERAGRQALRASPSTSTCRRSPASTPASGSWS